MFEDLFDLSELKKMAKDLKNSVYESLKANTGSFKDTVVTNLKSDGISSKTTVYVNGHRIEIKDGSIYVDSEFIKEVKNPINVEKESKGAERITRNKRKVVNNANDEILRNTTIDGDILGSIMVTGDNVTVVVEGDVMGMITGAKNVTIKGDHLGMSI